MTIMCILSKNMVEPGTVYIAICYLSPAEGEDFTLSRNEEVFGIGAANGNTMSILVDILPDPLVERTECFTLAGTIGTPAAPGSTFVGGDVTICINDNNSKCVHDCCFSLTA